MSCQMVLHYKSKMFNVVKYYSKFKISKSKISKS